MTYQFRKAIRSQTSVLIALAGSSGSGKTYSALRLARGLAGPTGTIALIDTEAGRALHYAEQFPFDHLDLRPPFSPSVYADAIEAAKDYNVVIIDSKSHEWSGEGGCQDMHDAEHARLGGAESTNILAWREPKLQHKRMMSRLLQCRAHLIFCLRAEEKIKFEKHPQTGKTAIVQAGWQPICEKNFMYEQTVSFLLRDDHPGVGQPIKLQEQHKPCFPAGAVLDETAGRCLAAWARGGAMTGAGTDRQTGDPVQAAAGKLTAAVLPAAPASSIERSLLIGEIGTLLDRFNPNVAAKLLKKHLGLASRADLTSTAIDLSALNDFLLGMERFLREKPYTE